MFRVTDLQAVEPTALAPAEGIVTVIDGELDSMGFNRVTVIGPTPQAVVAYCHEQWSGDADPDWFQTWVIDRVEEVAEPRTVLVHLNVEAAHDDPRTADEIADVILAALEVGLEGAPGSLAEGEELAARRLVVSAPLCEEV